MPMADRTVTDEKRVQRANATMAWKKPAVPCKIIQKIYYYFYYLADHNPSHSQKNDNAKDVDNDCGEDGIPTVHQGRLLEQKIPGKVWSQIYGEFFVEFSQMVYLCHHGVSSTANGCCAKRESGSG
jgi:hypothetical protein